MRNQDGVFHRAKPFIAVVFLQFGFAGMDILTKVALNKGMSNYVLVVYRHVVATVVIAPFAIILDKKTRPKMTVSIFAKILLLGLLEPVIDQNLYFIGLRYTSATFAASMCNILPAITFLMACILRLEWVSIKSTHSQAKVVGTLATVTGAMLMTLTKGPMIDLFWTEGRTHHEAKGSVNHNGISLHNSIKGSLMITAGCFSWSIFIVLQAITLRTYPVELSLTAWICLVGTAEGAIAALVMERGNTSIWSISWDSRLLAALYSGIVCSGLAYYIQGVVMKDRGPVFVTAFNPLSMVIVAIISSFVLAEQLYLGRVMGAIVIVAGLYLVVWGKGKDYQTSSPLLDEEKTAPAKQIILPGSGDKENPMHEVVIVPSRGHENGDDEQSRQIHDK
ncbi:WAT1-related protein At2g37460-like [Malania oleifera]|uniref:WAT1-related protein At2g37460-like n=1 Tax=Malania oleifera TaxID=397392 RepID=UPI0025AEB44E|nr:WAT1-related protein At2g37460-like [Malania oleifera]